ncbi:hypothetical protein [Kineosporia sp. A_224]|uniref:hypothetical protein n=1 Tax=Kineosporia sp. A_224 TaxID=1962180 RepID=UPI00117A1454|nr:hypothetical protein [Kineosporia sp. A_224]
MTDPAAQCRDIGHDQWGIAFRSCRGGVDRVEVWEGNLAFELRGFTPEKDAWDAADVEAARAVYPEQQVALSPERSYSFVGPTTEVMVAPLVAGTRTPRD